jgi:hypothetical protein
VITNLFVELNIQMGPNRTAHFFAFPLIIEGTTEKVLQFLMPLVSMYNKNIGFNKQKCIFEHNGDNKTSIN